MRGLTPFEFVTGWEATKDLPRISDGCTYQCTKEPDHVTIGISTELRSQIRAVPTFPRGMASLSPDVLLQLLLCSPVRVGSPGAALRVSVLGCVGGGGCLLIIRPLSNIELHILIKL